jgi:hypothetical protein
LLGPLHSTYRGGQDLHLNRPATFSFCSNFSRPSNISSRTLFLVLFGLICFAVPKIAIAQEAAAPGAQDAAVQAQMRNVMYHFTESVAVHIKSLNGSLLPRGKNEFPIFDDKESFILHIDNAEITMAATDLANVLNSYVFAPPHNVLSGVSITLENGQMKIKGRLHQKGDIPFETDGTLSLTPDGNIRLHSEKVKALHLPVKRLMDMFGIEISDLIKNGKVPGVEAQEDDLILDVQKLLPPPQMQGRLTALRIEGDTIVLTFGGSDVNPVKFVQSGNYMFYHGNRLRFGKLTMADADLTLIDMDPNDPFDFYLERYKDQLVTGYSKITPKFGLRTYVKDFNKLSKPKLVAKQMSTEQRR